MDSADDLPEGLDFDAGSRTLSGTPTAAGTYTMAYSATDDDGDSDNLPSFQLVVDSVPTLANAVIGSHTYVKNQTIDDVQLPLAEGGTDTVSYSLTATTLDGTVDSADDLPEGLDFAASSRTLSGTPTAAGTYAMTYTATDTDSDSDTRTFELTVAAFVPVCDRTAQVRDALVARLKSDGTLGSTDGCAQVTDGMLSGLTGTLDVSNPSTKLTALVASDFSGLSSLEVLDLSDNSLTASGLPTNVFSALTSLTGLNLGTNQLATLPATLLTPLTSLTELQLNNNQLASLPATLLSTLTKLTELQLNNNQLASLPATLLSTLTKLTELHLNNNQLASLPATLLSTLTSLSELKLHNNQLSELPAGLFSGLTSLSASDLDFRDNKTALVLPLVLGYQRSSQSEGSLSVGLAIGAPVALTIPLQVAAGDATLSASTVTLAAGGTSSGSITVMRGAGNANITLSFGTLPVLTDTGLTLGQGASVVLSVPVFATASLPDQTLLEGTALTPVQFEEASGLDTPLVHVLSTTTDDGTVDSADNLPVGLDFNASTRILSGTPTASGVYALTYTATDSDGDTATQTLNLTVEADTAPSFGASTVAQQDYKQFAAISDLVLPAATGGNGTPIYSLTATTDDGTVDSADDLPEGLDFDAGSRTLSGTPTAAGTYTMAYSATDDDGDSDNLPSFQLVVDSVPTLANAVIGSHSYVKDQTIDDVQLPLAEGGTDTVSYSLTATTLDGTVDSADDLPEGLDFAASSRTLSGTPTAAGTYAMTYTATDTDSDSDTRTFELTVAAFVPVCDRTAQVRDALVARLKSDGTLGSTDGCAQVTDGMLSGLTGTLDVSNPSPKLTALVASDFSGLSSLEVLDLSDNSLTASGLPANVFSALTSLTGLNLGTNQLATLPATLLTPLTSLTELQLNNNQLASLPATLLSTLTKLTELHLNNNQLASLPATLLSTLTSLSELKLHNNQLSELPAGLFSGLTSLSASDLDFRDNKTALVLPLVLDYQRSSQSEGSLSVGLAIGAPVALTIPLQVAAGTATLSASTVTLAAGGTSSDAITVTRGAGNADITLSFGTLPVLTDTGLTLGQGANVILSVPVFATASLPDQTLLEGTALTPVQFEEASGLDTPLVHVLSATTDDGTVDSADNLPTGLDFNASTRILSGTPTAPGVYALTYTATDSDGDTATQTLNLTVVADTAPSFGGGTVAQQDYKQFAANSDLVLPAATGGNGTPIYSLTATTSDGTVDSVDTLPEGLDFDAGSRTLSGTPTAAGTYTMTYVVTDDDGDSDSLPSFQLVVDSVPTLANASIENQAHVKGYTIDDVQLPLAEGGTDTVSYSLSATTDDGTVDSDDDLPAGLDFTASTRTLSGTPTAVGTYAMTYTATDADSDSGARTFELTVVAFVPVCNRTAQVRDALVARLKSDGTLGSTEGCAQVTDGMLSGLTGTLDVSNPSPKLTALVASDFSGLSSLEVLDLSDNSLTASGLPANVFSLLTSLTGLNLSTNQLASLPATLLSTLTSLSELKLNNNQLSELPAGLFSGLTNLIVGDLDFRDNNAALVLPLVLDYQRSSQSQGSLSVGLAIGAPVALSIPLQVAGGTATLSASTVTLAAGGTSSDAITVTRGAGNADITLSFGTLPVLTDTGLTLEQGASVTLSVPVFATVSLPDQTLLQGTALTPVQFEEASGLDTPLVHVLSVTTSTSGVTLTDGLPTGLSFDEPNLILSGTPTVPGVYALTYTATDSDGDTATQTLNLTVEADTAPSFDGGTVAQQDYKQFAATSVILPAATGGNGTPVYSLTATTSDGTVDSADTLPEGLDFDAGTRTLSGTPTAAGTYTMAYVVTDDDGDSDSLPFQLVVDSVPTLANAVIGNQAHVKDQAIDAVQLPLAEGGTDTVSYSLRASTTDGTVDSADDLPEGLDFAASSRTLSGTPTAVGTYAMTYTATDTDSDSAIRTFELTVTAFYLTCNRTAQVRDALVARLKSDGTLGSTDGCAQVTDSMLTGLTGTLDVSNPSTKLTALVASDFSGLSNLEGLDLGANSLTASGLPANVFSALTSLTELQLNNNQLASLSANVFSPLTSLTELQLNNNQLASLSANVFSPLTSLAELNLSNNQLTSLPATLLTPLTSLTELQLNNNQLASLPANLLSALTSLTELKLNNNQLSALPNGLFSGLTSLIVGDLDFRNNKTALALPMVLDYQRSSQTQGSLSVGLAIGAPVALTIPLQVAAGTATLSASTVTLAAGGTSSGSITVTRGAGNADITLSFGTLPVLTDTGLTLGQGASVVLSVPVFATASLPDQTLTEGTALTPVQFEEASGLDTPLVHVLSATTDDGDLDSADNLPVGLDFNASTRTLSGTPTAPGVYALTYTATDSDGDAATQTLNLTVEADTAPSFGGSTVARQDYKQFAANSDLILPAATGGNGTPVYSLTATTR